MKRRWQIWLWYGGALAIATAALGWLSVALLRLERAEATTRAMAEQEERIRRALWRIDTRVTPFVAQEMTRPYEAYAPAETVVKSPAAETPGPGSLPLAVPPKYVRLYFEIHSDGTWRSPQLPEDALREDDLRRSIDYAGLLSVLPQQTLPPVSLPDVNAVAVGDPRAAQNLEKQFEQAQSTSSFGTATDNDLARRAQALRQSNVKQFAQQRASVAAPSPPESNSVGISRALWIKKNLVLARRVAVRDQTVVQVCWLDWSSLKDDLAAEVADLLPSVELRGIHDPPSANDAHMLATLPVELVVPPPVLLAAALTPLRITLVIAWVIFALAAAALVALIMGVVTLSERREAFVSAVTHELRTPLTTFRVYTEMLEQDMLPSSEQRQQYLHTLSVEANRLTHLVENVLAYARIERGRLAAKRERIAVSQLMTRVIPRLSQRTAQAGMELNLAADESAHRAQLDTDPAAIEQILFNLVDNACKYAGAAANKDIEVSVEADGAMVRIRVQDHGPGIGPQEVRRLFQPFSKSAQQAAVSAPGVGLGLALSRRLARQLGGDLVHETAAAAGTRFTLLLPRA